MNVNFKESMTIEQALHLKEVVTFLIEDEEEAISGYDDSISKLKDNQKAVDLFNHIKEEEKEHIRELKELLNS